MEVGGTDHFRASGPGAPAALAATHDSRGVRADAAEALLAGELAVVVVDALRGGLLISWVNSAFARITGYTLTAARRRGKRLISPEYAGGEVLGQLSDRVRVGAPFSMTLPIVRADGHEIAVPVTITPMLDPDGSLRRVVVVQREGVEPFAVPPVDLEYHSRHALEIVARVSDLIAEVEDSEVLEAIAKLLTRRLFAWCGFMVDHGVLSLIESINLHPSDRTHRASRGRTTSDEEDPVSLLITGHVMRRVPVDLGAAHVPGSLSAQVVDLVRPQLALHPRALQEVIVLPLLGRNRTLGLMAALPHDQTMEAGGEPGTVLELVARRVGLALDNAQLYRSEHVMAETLQRAMLPEQDQIDGLDVWTYYAPNSEHAQVGGDWYDVVHLNEDVVATVIGDVVGHDVEAAATMGQLRSVVRAFAAELVDPGTVLSRVDRITAGMRFPRPASLVYATLTRVVDPKGSWTLRYSRAGHLPALLVRAGEVTDLDGAGGRLIGFGGQERETASADVCPGDVLVFYTDGLVERRDRPVQDGVAALRKICAAASAPDAAGIGEELLMRLADAPEDDIAIVVIRVPFPKGHPAANVAGPRRRRWRLSLDTASIGTARRATARACEAWGYPRTSETELVVSELVANAVMHGRGSILLTLMDTGDGLRIEVEDGNPVPPTPLEVHPARVGGYGMHIVARLADWGWRPSGAGKVVWARPRTGREGGGNETR